ncbi:MAG: DNA polymerase Y family protein [Acidobacteriota bacterium]
MDEQPELDERGSRMREAVYVCLRLAEFAAQALLRLRPAMKQAAVAVMEGEPPLEQVCAMNALAARTGVKPGMTRTELESFSELQILRRSVVEERCARAVLIECAEAFTPRMEEQPDTTALVLVLDMSGSRRMFGSPQAAARRIQQAARQLGFFVQVGVSANFFCAVCLARAAGSRLLLAPAGEEANALAPLPLAMLLLTAQQHETLALWGLRTIGELAALPEVDLVVRLGQEGKRLRLLARGEHPHLMIPLEPEVQLVEQMEFDAPVELLDSLLFVLASMLAQLIQRAQNRELALASVTVRLRLDGGGEHERTLKPALPLLDRALLLKLLHLDLEAHSPPAAVLAVELTAEAGSRSKVQMGLFSPPLPEPMRLEVTLARIAALVGEERVGRARLVDSHRPESFVMERFSVRVVSPKKNRLHSHAIALRQLRPPVAVHVQSGRRRIEAFHLEGTRFEVHRLYGPWRRSGQWWSQDVWSREEWDVAAQSNAGAGLLCLLAHDLLRDRWQMVALYD